MPNNGGKGSNTSDLSNPSVRSTSINGIQAKKKKKKKKKNAK